jgi:transposase
MLVGCWAHARRKFDEAVKALPKSQQKKSSAGTGLMYCSKLFEIEDKLEELPPEERNTQRQNQAKPVLDAFLAWAKTRNAAPKSALGKHCIIFWNNGHV